MPINQHYLELDRRNNRTKKKNTTPNYQYNAPKYHPIQEYLETAVEQVTSDTPSFVLEVTWPRIALFYHPASPICLQLRDRYVAVARDIRRRSIRAPVEFYAVSCEIHRDACEDLGVLSVPRILGFPKGSIDGKVIERTRTNDIEVREIVQKLSLNLKDEEEDEVAMKELQFEKQQMDAAALAGMNLRSVAGDTTKNENQEEHLTDSNGSHHPKGDHLHEILHPHSALKDVFADAMTSFLHSIDLQIDNEKRHDDTPAPWSARKFRVFREWIDLMHWTLPTRDMASLHNIIGDLRNNLELLAGDSPDMELNRILTSHDYYHWKPIWSSSCAATNPEDNGFACGFWKLLHIMSIGVAEQHAHVMGDVHRVTVSHVLSVVQEFVHDFGFASSDAGRKEILESYDECQESEDCRESLGIDTSQNGLLQRFRRRRTVPEPSDPVWKQLGLWFWQAHQYYRAKRLQKQQRMGGLLMSPEDLQWPPPALCPKCYASGKLGGGVEGEQGRNDDDQGDADAVEADRVNHFHDEEAHTTWNKIFVYEHLKREYWPRELQSPRVVVLDRWHVNSKRKKSSLFGTQHEVLLHIIGLLFMLIALAIVYHRNHRYRTGYHKKHSGARHRRKDWYRGRQNRHSYKTTGSDSDDTGYSQYTRLSYSDDDTDCGSYVGRYASSGASVASYRSSASTATNSRSSGSRRTRKRNNHHHRSRMPLAFVDE